MSLQGSVVTTSTSAGILTVTESRFFVFVPEKNWDKDNKAKVASPANFPFFSLVGSDSRPLA